MSRPDSSPDLDPELLLPLQARADRVVEKLRTLSTRFDARHDPRAVFAYVYLTIARELRDRLAEMHFDDPEWIVQLEEAFAARYLNAIGKEDEGADPPTAWKIVSDAIANGRATVIEELAFSMSAHIIYDLPLALRDAGFTAADSVARVRDYHKVNGLLEEAIERLQVAVSRRYNPFLGWLDAIGKSHDENLTNYGVRLGRGMAWYNSMRLGGDEQCEDVLRSLEASVEQVVYKFRNPSSLLLRYTLRIINLVIRLGRRWPKAPPPIADVGRSHEFGQNDSRRT